MAKLLLGTPLGIEEGKACHTQLQYGFPSHAMDADRDSGHF